MFKINRLAIGLAILGILLAVTGSAHAEPKARRPKPVVCSDWEIFHGEHRNAAICNDGKKPIVLTRFAIVDLPADPTFGPQRVLVGWR